MYWQVQHTIVSLKRIEQNCATVFKDLSYLIVRLERQMCWQCQIEPALAPHAHSSRYPRAMAYVAATDFASTNRRRAFVLVHFSFSISALCLHLTSKKK